MLSPNPPEKFDCYYSADDARKALDECCESVEYFAYHPLGCLNRDQYLKEYAKAHRAKLEEHAREAFSWAERGLILRSTVYKKLLRAATNGRMNPQDAKDILVGVRRGDSPMNDDNEDDEEQIFETCSTEQQKVLQELNDKYMVVNENGNLVIYSDRLDQQLNRHVYDRMALATLTGLYANRFVWVMNADGKHKKIPIAKWWFQHKQRRQYIQGVTFEPGRNGADGGLLNLWRDFGVDVKEAKNWDLLKTHIKENICSNQDIWFEYLMNWMAQMV
jgi:hypothetical protein